jgi:hypothetical protein
VSDKKKSRTFIIGGAALLFTVSLENMLLRNYFL